ncbi:MAG: dipeptide epimerase [Candidatus Eisenbacteria bacterium]|nr:dipeptide epimerase [Candidatus Eisenbacteria bacterium]
MKLTFEPLNLETKHLFAISRGGSKVFKNVLLRIESDGLVGLGEAGPSSFHGENQRTVLAALETICERVSGMNPFSDPVCEEAKKAIGKNFAAKAALDMAVHDIKGRKAGVPVWFSLGISRETAPTTSVTIGLDEIDAMRKKVKEASSYPILKVKLGTDKDVEILRAMREETDAVIRVDANCAWSAKEAVRKIKALESFGIEFVEQPVPPNDIEGLRFVRERVDVPIIADESAGTPEDIPKLVGAVDGINIKLQKCGGITEALKMIHTARSFGLSVMIGCMIESSLSVTAAAHLSPLVDYADLDGPILLKTDPFKGVLFEKGRIVLPSSAGLGVERRQP